MEKSMPFFGFIGDSAVVIDRSTTEINYWK
jgi:hypothetical protein